MNSKDFRNDPLFLRNEFISDGMYGIPLIKKQTIDLKDVQLIACSDTSSKDTINLNKGIHHFVDDFRFESLYNKPDKNLDKYKKYRFVLTPDYSLYAEMDLWRQIESVGKNRWVGAYWQKNGIIVIPTVSWSNAASYSFCFDGIEKNSIVAIGMIGCKRGRIPFMRGYNAMLEKIEPEAVICLGEPFPEMDGNIIKVDYISSRKVVRYGR